MSRKCLTSPLITAGARPSHANRGKSAPGELGVAVAMAPHPSRDQSGIEESSPSTSTVVVGAIKSATTHRRKHHDNLGARPELLSLAAHGHEGDTRDAGLRRQLRPQSQ